MPTPRVLVATVTVVFAPASAEAAEPEAIAALLLEHEDVSTVRISAHGRASGFRVDVPQDGAPEAAAAQAQELAHDVGGRLGVSAEVVSVGLVRDDDRVEVFRVGERGEELVWGQR